MTDSTASIPAELCQALGITVVPIPIHFGSETFIDGVDPAELFYERLASAERTPTTSTPSPGAFVEAYQGAAEGADAVISIHVMETKSTLVNTARLAAGMLPHLPIHVIDSQTTTLGLGLLVIAAARAALAGQPAEQILRELERRMPEVATHAVIRDLTQLRRSGRVSLGQALVAGVLAIKPILYIGQGVAEVAGRVRGWPRAVDEMVEMALARAGAARVNMAVVHTGAPLEATQLLEAVRERFNWADAFVAEAGSALAAHAGPGALGIVTLPAE